MKVQFTIAKMDWTVPCKDIWTIIEADSMYELTNKLYDVVVAGIKLDVREFIGYSIYLEVNDVLMDSGTVWDYIDIVPELKALAEQERSRQIKEEKTRFTRKY